MQDLLEDTILNLLPKALQTRLPKEIRLISVTPKESRKLNTLYRSKDKATNVLSFRYGSEYGEIILCSFVIRREAKAQGNTFEYQMTWMVVHGIIHLAELHHEQSEMAGKQVSRLEQKILNSLFGK